MKAVGGTDYLAGGGAGGYQDDAVFAREGLGLIPQGFAPTPYPSAGRRPSCRGCRSSTP
ncbi:MAG: hypothetical protein IPK56_11485 [Elusimicrobia bacterium]|nr:hypothetical protein [Elusimicrobiota bacterium]